MSLRHLFVALTALTLVAGAGTQASAATKWQKNHPRRVETNKRIENQHDRVNNKVASGQMTQKQANHIKHEDHHVRQAERAMARKNGGHITKREQRRLNKRENKISKQIKKD